MTVRLAAALQQYRYLPRVLCHQDGRPLAEHMTDLLATIGRRANVRSTGPHILRHCAASRTITELIRFRP